jgi:hypothetical protein
MIDPIDDDADGEDVRERMCGLAFIRIGVPTE